MSEFDHHNILTLIGVCLDGGPAPYIIMPFMENGSLLSYLKKERENLVLEPGTDEKVVSMQLANCTTTLGFRPVPQNPEKGGQHKSHNNIM